MKKWTLSSKRFQERFTLLVALLFCLFISSVEYVPQDSESAKTEQSSENSEQTFLNVAVDAVVPFVIHVADTVFYFIHHVFSFLLKLPSLQAVSVFSSNQLVEILFEQIISTKGP
jgi:hypothetical protein